MLAKIGDLGITYVPNLTEKAKVDSRIGPVAYLPTEFFEGICNTSTDIFSFGLVMNYIITGKEHDIVFK